MKKLNFVVYTILGTDNTLCIYAGLVDGVYEYFYYMTCNDDRVIIIYYLNTF